MYHYGNRLTAPPGPLPPLMLPPSPNMLSPVLSPSFWPPTPTSYGSPFCSPPIATCVVNNGSGGGNSNGMSSGDPPPGLTKMHGHHGHGSYGHHSSQGGHGFGFNNNLTAPTPEFSLATMNAMKQSMHLPLMDTHSIKSFPTPASSTVSETSGSSHPMNNLIQEFRDFDLKRKAPGWERSNTTPMLGRMSGTASSTGSASDHGSISGESADNSIISNKSMQDKKYMAVKGMHDFITLVSNSTLRPIHCTSFFLQQCTTRKSDQTLEFQMQSGQDVDSVELTLVCSHRKRIPLG